MANEQKMSTSERIEEGYILVRTIIEMLGSPKEHIESTMKQYLETLKEKDSFEIIKQTIEPAELIEEKKLYSTYVELEIWFDNADALISFCFDSLPSSIEILEPDHMSFPSTTFSTMLNDLQAKLHHLDMALKNHNADKQAAGESFRTLIINFIAFGLQQGDKTQEELQKITGIDEKRLTRILEDLSSRGIISQKGKAYSMAKKP